MDQAGIIRDLLIWLEGHLDQPLSLDNVAAKAGYSKWHLQRMFKDVTGHAIGAYIRARRLSKSAVALRLTARPLWILRCNIASTLNKLLLAHSRNNFRRHQRCIAVHRNGAHSVFAHQCDWVNLRCLRTSLSPSKIRNCSAPRKAIPARWNRFQISVMKCVFSSGATSLLRLRRSRQCCTGLTKRVRALKR